MTVLNGSTCSVCHKYEPRHFWIVEIFRRKRFFKCVCCKKLICKECRSSLWKAVEKKYTDLDTEYGLNHEDVCCSGECFLKLYRYRQEEKARQERRMACLRRSEVVSINYKGKLHPHEGDGIYLETDSYKERGDAVYALKLMAAKRYCDYIINMEIDYVQCEQETDRGGTYYYKKWYASGIAYRKK